MKPWDACKRILIGGGKNVRDPRIFQRLSLIAFFAWVGLGADGLSSSNYGPRRPSCRSATTVTWPSTWP